MPSRSGLSGSQPPLLYRPYQATTRRAPARPLIRPPEGLSEYLGVAEELRRHLIGAEGK
jgi:hypothetical protein